MSLNHRPIVDAEGGGLLEMPVGPRLSGHRVLVVEDDWLLAIVTAGALRRAGAEVVGPCLDQASVRDEIEEVMPTAAVLDLNLGTGPSFTIARTLRDRGIPFVFCTGYGPEVIPAEFRNVPRIGKPAPGVAVVQAVCRMVGASR